MGVRESVVFLETGAQVGLESCGAMGVASKEESKMRGLWALPWINKKVEINPKFLDLSIDTYTHKKLMGSHLGSDPPNSSFVENSFQLLILN